VHHDGLARWAVDRFCLAWLCSFGNLEYVQIALPHSLIAHATKVLVLRPPGTSILGAHMDPLLLHGQALLGNDLPPDKFAPFAFQQLGSGRRLDIGLGVQGCILTRHCRGRVKFGIESVGTGFKWQFDIRRKAPRLTLCRDLLKQLLVPRQIEHEIDGIKIAHVSQHRVGDDQTDDGNDDAPPGGIPQKTKHSLSGG
jgi:hypothetical protein